MPYDKPGTAQVKFKEQSKSQGTEEQHRTHKPQCILDGKIKKKNKNLAVLSDLHRITQGPDFT